MLTMESNIENKVLIVDVQGVLDSHTSNDFKSWLEEQFIEGFKDFALDLSNTRYLSSRGIGAILQVNQIISNKGGKIVLFHVRDEIKHLIQFLKIDQKIHITDSKKEAIQSLVSFGSRSSIPESYLNKEVNHNKDYTVEDLEEKPKSTRQYTEEFTIPTNIFTSEEEQIQSQNDLQEIIIKDNKKVEIKEKNIEDQIPANKEVNKKENNTTISSLDVTNQEKIEMNTPKEPKINIADLEAERKLDVKQKIFCPHCGSALRVGKPGKYICPSCEGRFSYPF